MGTDAAEVVHLREVVVIHETGEVEEYNIEDYPGMTTHIQVGAEPGTAVLNITIPFEWRTADGQAHNA